MVSLCRSIYIIFIYHICSVCTGVSAKLNYFTRQEQIINLANALSDCQDLIEEYIALHGNSTSGYCPIGFDGATCWPLTTVNSTASIQCPDYVNKLDSSETAYRYCDALGAWSYDYGKQKFIVNYTQCTRAAEELDLTSEHTIGENMSPLIQRHLGRIRMVYTVGYSVSVTSLTIALTIIILLRRLHCPRNMIHMNMFVSFILRGSIQLLIELLYNNELDLSTDNTAAAAAAADLPDIAVESGVASGFASGVAGKKWQCKLLATVWMYTRLSNYVWIFVEGFYLHTLIFINTFSDKSGIKWFITAGWGSPLLFVIPWMLLRIYMDDFGCWTAYKSNRAFRWIIEAPIVLLIVANFIFFLIIIRLLFTKLRASESSSREARIYRKLAKSTLVLIPLFGVHYVVFLFAEFFYSNDTLELIRFYFDTFFTSFQGLMVGILFCFMNGEVRTEIIKKWKRWRTLKSVQLSSTQQNTTTQITSMDSFSDSLTPLNRGHSKHASIQSIKSSNGPLSHSPIVEETQLLLSIDDNQNELRVKDVALNGRA